MKLNREVCKRCFAERGDAVKEAFFDQLWYSGSVPCPEKNDTGLWGRWIRVEEQPPEGCKYLMEHLVGQ